LTSVIKDLPKDPKFINELSEIIGEKLKQKSMSMMQTKAKNTIEDSPKEKSNREPNTAKSWGKKQKSKIEEGDYNSHDEILEEKNHNFVVDKTSIKHKIKKAKIKSSSCNREASAHSTGATRSKLDYSRDKDERSFTKDTAVIDKHLNSFLDECLTDDKTFQKNRGNKKKSKNKNRPSTSLFNKKRKSSGNALLPIHRANRGNRADSAMSANKSNNKKKYRPASAFATHYTKSKPKI